MSDGAYEHRYHVGNVGDVLKHVALLATLRARPPRLVIDTHAGAGRYKLGHTGEWQQGVAHVMNAPERPPFVEAYAEAIRTIGIWKDHGRVYPGSPNLAQHRTPEAAALHLHDIADGARADLHKYLGDDPRVRIHASDGFAALAGHLEGAPEETLVLIDPPYSNKAEWRAAADALITIHQAHPSATAMLWYPIISLSRPNTLHGWLREAGLPATAVELHTTPLELRRKALNGSGLVLLREPPGVLPGLLAELPWLGARCATHGGRFSARIESLG